MILFFISLLICVFFHELAHLIVAKLCKCNVLIFSIGFGKPYYQIVFQNTQYRISPWLFGGYCKLDGELEFSRKKHTFFNLSYSKKLCISLAGIVTNVVMGLLTTHLGKVFVNYELLYFGYLSFWLGITNVFPFIPCLDGGYCFYYPLLTKIHGYKKGTKIFIGWVKKSFNVIMLLNILSIIGILVYVVYQLITTGGIHVSF